MILMTSRITLYNNLRTVFFILCLVFVAISIIYGVRVHIISIIQKYFGFEKRREIARRQSSGYVAGDTTARMRAVHRTSGRTSGTLDTRYIDVSHVKTAKIPNSQNLRQEGTTLLQSAEDTVVLPQGEDTVVLGAGTGGTETTVLTTGTETTVLTAGMETTVRTAGTDTTVLTSEADTVVLQENQDTVVLSPEQRVHIKRKNDVMIVHGEDII